MQKLVHLGTSVDVENPDREQIAAILYVTRNPHIPWHNASLHETQIAYKQADAIMNALSISSTEGK